MNVFTVAPWVLLLTSMVLLSPAATLLNSNSSVVLEWSNLLLSSYSISYPLMFDQLSLLYSSMVTLISASVLFFSKNYMSEDKTKNRFTWLVIMFIISMLVLIFTPNLMVLLLGWDGLGVTSFLLVIYYQNKKSLSAGVVTIMMNRVGDACLLISLGLLFQTQMINMWSMTHSVLTISLLTIAASTKSAQIPFSSWLPAAMAAPTPVSALVHSSTLVTAGVFILIRLSHHISLYPMVGTMLLTVSTMTMIMSGLSALVESDMKKVIALSTLSQLGLMMSAISLNLPQLATFHMMTHAMFKALLFITAGTMISKNNHYQDIRSFGMGLNSTPITTTSASISLLALSGTPFLAGFYSKDVIIELMLGGGWDILLASLNVLGLLLTASYSVRFASLVFMSPTSSTSYKNEVSEKPSTYLPMTVMTLLSVFLGSSLLWLMPAQAHPQLPGILTLLPLSIVLVGAITSFIIISSDRYVLSSVTLHTSSSMWYLPQLTTSLSVGWAMKSSASVLNLLDLGWVETTSLSTSSLSAGYESYHVVSLTSISPTNMVLSVTIPICLMLLYL